MTRCWRSSSAISLCNENRIQAIINFLRGNGRSWSEPGPRICMASTNQPVSEFFERGNHDISQIKKAMPILLPDCKLRHGPDGLATMSSSSQPRYAAGIHRPRRGPR